MKSRLQSLCLRILDEKAGRPVGNPFRVKGVWRKGVWRVEGMYEVGTGISIGIGDDLELKIEPLIVGFYVLGHRFQDGELVLLLQGRVGMEADSGFADKPVALVHIVRREQIPVRFVEMTPDGERMVTGEPREAVVADPPDNIE